MEAFKSCKNEQQALVPFQVHQPWLQHACIRPAQLTGQHEEGHAASLGTAMYVSPGFLSLNIGVP